MSEGSAAVAASAVNLTDDDISRLRRAIIVGDRADSLSIRNRCADNVRDINEEGFVGFEGRVAVYRDIEVIDGATPGIDWLNSVFACSRCRR